jgi:hypothetical protein
VDSEVLKMGSNYYRCILMQGNPHRSIADNLYCGIIFSSFYTLAALILQLYNPVQGDERAYDDYRTNEMNDTRYPIYVNTFSFSAIVSSSTRCNFCDKNNNIST